jgi:ferrous iron transport protein A
MAAQVSSDLTTLKPGEAAEILQVADGTEPRVSGRLKALGFVPGTIVKVVRRAPLGDPIEYELRGGRISLRASEARLVTIH